MRTCWCHRFCISSSAQVLKHPLEQIYEEDLKGIRWAERKTESDAEDITAKISTQTCPLHRLS